LNICAFDDYLKGQTARLPKLAHVEQLTPRVLRVLGQNPGKVSGSCDHVGSLRVRYLTGRCSSLSKAPTHTSLEAAANA
jgi:hypothetical protein